MAKSVDIGVAKKTIVAKHRVLLKMLRGLDQQERTIADLTSAAAGLENCSWALSEHGKFSYSDIEKMGETQLRAAYKTAAESSAAEAVEERRLASGLSKELGVRVDDNTTNWRTEVASQLLAGGSPPPSVTDSPTTPAG